MSNAIDIARRLSELGQTKEACTAYTIALHQSVGVEPEQELECAIYLFQHSEDYKVSYTTFRNLYNRGFFREELLPIMTDAFYTPNIKLLKNRYEKNCKLLSKYPYIFRKDFPVFESLPIQFFPYDDNGYLPYDTEKACFGEYVNFNHEVIARNFFKNLDAPILADDVFSQYELEYLVDNVRKSEWVAKDNHIYLHYTNWLVFCSYLQCLNLRPLLEGKKLVFLMEDEKTLYPIDFKERFGIDYTQYPVKSVGVREINRMIWHTQLSAHNGGDFFNEIFFGHPNLIVQESIIFDRLQSLIEEAKIYLRKGKGEKRRFLIVSTDIEGNKTEEDYTDALNSLRNLTNVTEKDILVAILLKQANPFLDKASRIAPVIFLQPHFYFLRYTMRSNNKGQIVIHSTEYEQIRTSSLFQNFKYIKTFTPMRRITTSYGATVRFMWDQVNPDAGTRTRYIDADEENGEFLKMRDEVTERILNRSFMVDWQDRLYKDSVLVRFEDGKLNPKATFTALASFLDIPYTESMTYCSDASGINPESMKGNVRGFDPATVYRTYDEYANNAERYYLEYFMRDAYDAYGYDFHYYDGKPMNIDRATELIHDFTTLSGYMEKIYFMIGESLIKKALPDAATEKIEETAQAYAKEAMRKINNNRINIAQILLNDLRFINKNGQPLRMMPLLKLDPDLLEQPLYR